jgi:hypothetical protein
VSILDLISFLLFTLLNKQNLLPFLIRHPLYLQTSDVFTFESKSKTKSHEIVLL